MRMCPSRERMKENSEKYMIKLSDELCQMNFDLVGVI